MSDIKRDGDPSAEDEILQQYPSPTADGQDSGAYYHHSAAAGRDGAVQDSSPQQQATRPANLEELQLAAQLGQDLAAEQELPVPDPNLSVEDPSLQHILPHPEPHIEHPEHVVDHVVEHAAAHPYLPEHTQPDILPSQTHVPISLEHPLAHQYAIGDNTPPRKRSKVSRACDECRRKKVKCDAQSDTGENPCSNCKRSSVNCLFSRVPQKRGPSKGYIKELADRINSIEGKLEIQGPEDSVSRKRPYSSISGGDLSTPVSLRQVAWASEPRPIQPLSAAAADKYRGPYSANGLAPQPIAVKPDSTPSRPPVASMDSAVGDIPEPENPREIDDNVFDLYLTVIHSALPFLPNNKPRLQAELVAGPTQLRDAFTEAFYAAVTSFVDTDQQVGSINLADSILTEWKSAPGRPRVSSHSLLYLQTLILMIIEADNRPTGGGPDKGELLARAVAEAYSSRIYHSRAEPKADGEVDASPDEQARVRVWWTLVLLDRWHAIGTGTPALINDNTVVAFPGLRATLGETPFLLMRFARILSRASTVIPEFQSPAGIQSATYQKFAPFFEMYIEDYREDLPAHIDPITYPLVHLSYWHCRLLAYLLNPSAKADDILWAARESATLLMANIHLVTPFHHHFLALTSLCLGELSKVDKTRDDANEILRDLSGPTMPATAWDALIRDKVAELQPVLPSSAPTSSQQQPQSSVEATASQGLQHLADLATASVVENPYRIAANYEDMGFDPRPILGSGYLNFVKGLTPGKEESMSCQAAFRRLGYIRNVASAYLVL